MQAGREIKFRAWDKETKEMSHDFLNKNWLRVCIESPFVELMQFTGIRDKNGMEIYEGDIVLNEDSQHAIVKYDNSTAQYYLDLYEHAATSFMVGEITVKGNVYENPELLEGDNDASGA